MTQARVTEPMSPDPPEHVRLPLMLQRWSCISFLHWSYPPDEIRRLVPPVLDLDLSDGLAWVSMTPFLLEGVRPPFLPPLPWISRSPETNVRTYVRGPDGRRGIWFLSLDIGHLAPVIAARLGYSLPYMWSNVELRSDDGRIEYAGRRRLPRAPAEYRVTVAKEAPYADEELTDLDHWLTARFVFFSSYAGRILSVTAEHVRWPLWRARLMTLEASLLQAANIPPPAGPPVVHFSPGVAVRIGRPRFTRESPQTP